MAVEDIIRAAAARHGIDPDTLLQIGQVESNLNPHAHNASGAAGLFQFMPRTRAQYGNFDPYNAEASADAGARLASDNINVLRNGLGRDPSPGEVYLAHQQGGGGALKLLLNPDAPAAQLVGTKAVIQNGGKQGMSARDFASLWTSRFGGATPTGPSPAAMQNVGQALPAPTAPSAAGALGPMFAGSIDDAAPKPPKKTAAAPAKKLDLGALFASLSPNTVLAS